MNLVGLLSVDGQYARATFAAAIADKHVFLFKGGAASPLFCYFLVKRIAELLGCQVVSFDCSTESHQKLLAFCEVSFLTESLLWIKDLSALPARQRQLTLEYLVRYQGPHKICFAYDEVPTDSLPTTCVIEMDEAITASTYPLLFSVIHNKELVDDRLCQQVFKKFKHMALDAACMVAHYQEVLGRRCEDFVDQWLERLWPVDRSLFLLSQLLLAKDRAGFLSAWPRYAMMYPEEFWLAYWSDQLWQAVLFVELKGASKQGYRLPFSFMQRDWRSYTLQELVRAHAFLTTVDDRLKHGSIMDGIDLFCLKFLTHHFVKSA